MIIPDNGKQAPAPPKVQEFITVKLISTGEMQFSGSVLDNAQKTNVLLAKAIERYNVTRLWEKVGEKTLIRPPSATEKTQYA
jgi:hypothetical protein